MNLITKLIRCTPDAWCQVFGRRLLSSLTDAFGVMVFEEGFFHADPHPGNIFIRLGGLVEYFGYVKVTNLVPEKAPSN